MNSTPVDAAALAKLTQGRWKTRYTEIDGEMGPDEDDHFLIYKGDAFVVEKGGKIAHEGTFKIVTAAVSPTQIAYTYTKSFPVYLGAPRAGIIQLEVDALKCCFAPLREPAPKTFSTFPGAKSDLPYTNE